jgi:hypothetical protein
MEHFIRKYYPEARDGEIFTKECIQKLVSEFEFDLSKTLLATSVCSDEIIRSATNFRDYLENSHPFTLGGLAGYPFSGITGFKAFASHIPDGGSAVILYGPHIGVSADGTIGIVTRSGQEKPSSCCGALKASVRKLSMERFPETDADLDYQMYQIDERIKLKKGKLLLHDEPLVAATNLMYELIHERVHKLMDESEDAFTGHKIALIGGIIINTDAGLPDWFEVRSLEIIELI